jgi:UDP-2,3-diacylglucosamine pyrophosphatase LpxH
MTQTFDKIFISDTHLSTLRCQTDNIEHLLDTYDCQELYLLGDIIDLWKLKGIEYWPPNHTPVIKKIINKMSQIKINYIIGNHDDFFAKLQFEIDNLNICEKDIIKINNKRLLLIHGHQFDLAMKYFKFIAILGTIGYSALLHLNKWKYKLKKKPYSLSEDMDKKMGLVLGNFEKTIIDYTRRKKLDGVICGHTHKPELKIVNNLIYANAGDFVKNSTFITQSHDQLQLRQYTNGYVKIVKMINI